mgnify:CR=1 FL=1
MIIAVAMLIYDTEVEQEEWSMWTTLYAHDIVRLRQSQPALLPINVNIVPSHKFMERGRMDPREEPLLAREAMPPLAPGCSYSADSMFICCPWGRPCDGFLTHVYNSTRREYSAISQSDVTSIRGSLEKRCFVLKRLQRYERAIADHYPGSPYKMGCASIALQAMGLPPTSMSPFAPLPQANVRQLQHQANDAEQPLLAQDQSLRNHDTTVTGDDIASNDKGSWPQALPDESVLSRL